MGITWDDDGRRRVYHGATNMESGYWLHHQREIRQAELAAQGDLGGTCRCLNDDNVFDQHGHPWTPAELQKALTWLHEKLWNATP